MQLSLFSCPCVLAFTYLLTLPYCSLLKMANTPTLNYTKQTLFKQIIRSSTSVTLNYFEAMSAESRKDYTHKLNIVLKELRETRTNLKLIKEVNLCPPSIEIDVLINESEELVALLISCVKSLRRKKP